MTAGERGASIGDYLDELARQRRLSPHTVDNYRRDLHSLCRLIGELPGAADGDPELTFDAIQTHHIRRFVAQLHTHGLGGRSLGRTLSAWRGFYRWLGRQGRATHNPVDSVRPPKSARALPRTLSPDEASRLLEAPGESLLAIRDQAMFELFYSSGLRLAELAALDLSCLEDLLAGEVRVLGKRSKLRIVPVGGKTRKLDRFAETARGAVERHMVAGRVPTVDRSRLDDALAGPGDLVERTERLREAFGAPCEAMGLELIEARVHSEQARP